LLYHLNKARFQPSKVLTPIASEYFLGDPPKPRMMAAKFSHLPMLSTLSDFSQRCTGNGNNEVAVIWTISHLCL